MLDTNVLSDALNPELIETTFTQYGRNCVLLKEIDPGTKLRKINLFDLSSNSIIIKTDKTFIADSLFKKDLGKRKHCDYVIVTEISNQNYLLFIELKSNHLDEKEIIRQFKGSVCVIEYCNSILKHFHNESNFFQNFQYRFICFYTPNFSKRRTIPINKIKNNDPNKMLKYPSPYNPSVRELI